jgi:hypothetical protein
LRLYTLRFPDVTQTFDPQFGFARIRCKECGAVDGLNRIWVKRGFERYPAFDLFDTSGEYLMTAVLPDRDDTVHLKFHISKRGILAVPEDPDSYYCVYLIFY